MKNLFYLLGLLAIVFTFSCSKDDFNESEQINLEVSSRDFNQEDCGLTNSFCGDRNPIFPPQGPSIAVGFGIISNDDSDGILRVKCDEEVFKIVPFESFDRQRSFLVETSGETFILHNKASKLLDYHSQEEGIEKYSRLSVLFSQEVTQSEYNVQSYETTLLSSGGRLEDEIIDICDVLIDDDVYGIVIPCLYSISSNAAQFIQSLTANSDLGFVENIILQFNLLEAFESCPSNDISGFENGCRYNCVDPTCVIDQILANPVLSQESKDLMTANYLKETLGLSDDETEWLKNEAPDNFLDNLYDDLNSDLDLGFCETEDCAMKYSVNTLIDIAIEEAPNSPSVSNEDIATVLAEVHCMPSGECVLNSLNTTDLYKAIGDSDYNIEFFSPMADINNSNCNSEEEEGIITFSISRLINKLNTNYNFGISPAEEQLIESDPYKAFEVLLAANDSYLMTELYYGTSTTTNTCGDAFRHAFWAAGAAYRTDDSYVESFLTAHESDTPANEFLSKEMDLFNNLQGIDFHQDNPDLWKWALADALNQNLLCAGFLKKFENPNANPQTTTTLVSTIDCDDC